MIKILRYSKDKVVEGKLEDLRRKNVHVWVDCINPAKEDIEKIAKYSDIPIEVIKENIGDVRPRLNEIGTSSLLVYAAPVSGKEVISSVTMFISKQRDLITFRRKEVHAVEAVYESIKKGKHHLLKIPAEIVYSIIEAIHSSYFSTMTEVEERIDRVETEVYHATEKKSAKDIFRLKKDLIHLHKALIANREVIVGIEKLYLTKFTKTESYRFRTLYHEVFQLIDEEETLRDITTGVLELHLTSVSNNLNSIIKKMTAMASYVLIPTLIASIYGMNFQRISQYNMPELYWQYGYFLALAMMLASVVIMHIYFKKNKWL